MWPNNVVVDSSITPRPESLDNPSHALKTFREDREIHGQSKEATCLPDSPWRFHVCGLAVRASKSFFFIATTSGIRGSRPHQCLPGSFCISASASGCFAANFGSNILRTSMSSSMACL